MATIDSLEIEIKSNSSGAHTGLEGLADALEKIKKSTISNTAVKNLRELTSAMKELTPVASNAKKLRDMAEALGKLSAVGSLRGITNQIKSLPGALNGLSGLSVDSSFGAKLSSLATALAPLSQVKTGGFSTMVNALAKIGKVTDSLDDGTITRFAERIEKLNEKLTPLSNKMTTIQAGLRGINSSARSAGAGVGKLGTSVNATTLNLASMITVVQGAIAALQPLIRLLSSTISQAMEWDGVAARFGRGFGDQAEEVYGWIQRLNKEMGINVQQFMQYSSIFSTMLQGFGVGIEDSAKMALGYTELTYDIWAGYNDVYKNFADAAEAVKSAIAGEVEPIRRAGFTIVESTLEQTAKNHGLTVSLEKATEAQKSYLRYLTLVDQAHAQNLVGTYASEMNTAEGVIRTFAQQLKSLAQTFGSLFLPILVKVMPWLQAFVSLLTEAIVLVAGFFGVEIQPIDPKSWGKSENAIRGVGEAGVDASKGLDKATQAAKDLKNATLGIDELNVISPPAPTSSAGGSGVGVGGGGFEGLDIGSLWDDSIFEKVQFEVEKIKETLKEALKSITVVISGFAMAVGTILVVSGANIPMGLALMALGAVGLVSTIVANWDGMSTQLAKTLTAITSVLGGFLLAIGAVLAFGGVNLPLGIALMAVGAVSLATAATINWKFLNGEMDSTLSVLTGIVSGALLALGALFAFTGVGVGLGIALMVAGAVGLAATVALNWDSMPVKVKKVIGEITKIVSAAAIAIGAVLAFSGANIPLGLGLMVAGAIGLVAAENLNWDSTTGQVNKTLNTLTTFVSAAALGIGALLAFSGVGLPLGIALMAMGAVGLVASVTPNWNIITTKVKDAFNKVKEWVQTYGLLVLGVLLCITGVGIPAGVALIKNGLSVKTSSGSTVGDDLLKTIKDKWNGVKKWWDSKPALQEVSTKIADIKAKVSGAWSKAKDWWNKSKGSLSYTPTIGNIRDKLSSAWSSAKKWWSDNKGSLSYTPSIGSIKDKLSSAWNTAKTWWNKNVKLSIPSLTFNVTYTTKGLGTIKKAIVNALGLPGWPKLSFAEDGGIFNMGSLIWAGEAGAEIVANAGGGKTGVMNVNQMQEAVREGVYSAVVAAMRASQTNGGQSVNVYLDGKQLVSTIEKRQHERGAAVMGRQVFSY